MMRLLLHNGWTVPKKYSYPSNLPKFEMACLVYAATIELGVEEEYEGLWKPVMAKLYKELIFTVETFNEVPNALLINEWGF